VKLAIIDTETNGLDPDTCQILEIGCVLYDVDSHAILSQYSDIVDDATENAVEAINGIAPALLPLGRPPIYVLGRVGELVFRADLIVAHNASFDRGFMDAMQRRFLGLPVLNRPWLCTLEDVEFPIKSGRKLIEIAVAHGVPITDAHRALPDCVTLAKIFFRCHELGHDVPEMIRRGLRPKVTLQGKHAFGQNDRAREAGFSWVGDKKAWLKRVAAEDETAFLASLPFLAVRYQP